MKDLSFNLQGEGEIFPFIEKIFFPKKQLDRFLIETDIQKLLTKNDHFELILVRKKHFISDNIFLLLLNYVFKLVFGNIFIVNISSLQN